MIVPDNLKYGAISAFFTERAEGIDGKVPGRISAYPETDIFSPLQRHTDTIINLDLSRDKTIADGVITSRKGVLLGISTADCVPILIYDPQKQVVGAVHAGWRGTSKGILKRPSIQCRGPSVPCPQTPSSPSDPPSGGAAMM
ncbi:MAG TPA: laccase domain-containing protein [Nitrospirae bacterium]|nr:laccase domain-containing protein [Nitrospirota bacterium]